MTYTRSFPTHEVKAIWTVFNTELFAGFRDVGEVGRFSLRADVGRFPTHVQIARGSLEGVIYVAEYVIC